MKKEVAIFLFCIPLLYLLINPILYGVSIIGGCFFLFSNAKSNKGFRINEFSKRDMIFTCLGTAFIFTEAILRSHGYFITPELLNINLYVPNYSIILYFIIGIFMYHKYYRREKNNYKVKIKNFLVLLPVFIGNITYSLIVPQQIMLENVEYVLVYSFQTIVLAAIMEELFFRGFLYSSIKACVGNVKAIVISSVIFTLWHLNVLNGLIVDGNIINIQNARQLFIIFFLGIVNCIVFERSKSLIIPIVYHVINNGFMYILIGYFLS